MAEEPLTDELIKELMTAKGLKRKDLVYARKEGIVFSRSTGTLHFPEGPDSLDHQEGC